MKVLTPILRVLNTHKKSLLVSNQFYISTYDRNCQIAFQASSFVKLVEKSFTVQPGFGKLILKSKCDCFILPTNPQTHPDANYASVIFWGLEKDGSNVELEAELQGSTDDVLKFDITSDIPEGYCEIQVPLKYDIEADLENNASLKMEKMESDYVDVSTKQGSIWTKDVKGKDIAIKTDSGSVIAERVLQGNVSINAKQTVLKANRLQGLTLNIQAGELDTEIESSYVDEGTIFAESGKIHIKHLHGSTNLHLQRGNIFINGLHGSLQAIVNEGDAEIHVSEIKEDSLVQIGQGSLHLSFADASKQNLDLSSSSIEVPSDIARLGTQSTAEGVSNFKTDGNNLPRLRAGLKSGAIKLSVKDWFSSLGIKGSS